MKRILKITLSILLGALIVSAVAVGIGKLTYNLTPKTEQTQASSSSKGFLNFLNFNKEEQKPATATIKLLGDVFIHGPQLVMAKEQGQQTGKDYDFSKNFALIKDYTKDADLTILNNEFTVRPDQPVSGYPSFNTPKEMYDAFKEMGIDAVTNANNHAMDSGLTGLESTINEIDKAKIKHTGTYKNGDDKPYLILDANGIKVGLLSYTQFLNTGTTGEMDTEEKTKRVNMLDNTDQIKKDIENIRKQGAEFVIVYPHWGVEYETNPRAQEIQLAHQMVEWGADAVIGNHPHVVQPKETYTAPNKRKGVIYYALGNVMSNQREQTMGDIRTEQGDSAEIQIKRSYDKDGNPQVTIEKVIDHPIVDLMRGGSLSDPLIQVVLPEDYLQGGKKQGQDNINALELQRLKKDHDMILQTLALPLGA